MDYSIAFILPGMQTSRTVARYLKERGLEYPVLARSTGEAVQAARNLIPRGLRLVISYGLTMIQIENSLPVLTMELPFSGLDTLVAVREAIASTENGRIAHAGTPHMYHLVRRSLNLLGLDENMIYFCELTKDSNQEERVQEMLDLGYDTIIGGFKVANYAKAHGGHGIEFDVDELSIEIALLSAQTTVNNLRRSEERNELERAIMSSSSDGAIVLDPARRITLLNPVALEVFGKPANLLTGRILEEALSDNRLVDIETYNTMSERQAQNLVPVVLRELPVTINGENRGSVVSIKKVSEIQELEYKSKKDILLKGLVARHTFADLLGTSPAFLRAKEQAEVYAAFDSPLLIYGETGTGKELFAQSIHNASPRKDQPFVAINCAALTETLIDSELFGYVKGAFTGASRDGKQGLFEIANNGTIFLDEIAETSLSIQAKLLRVIQEGEVIRVGGDKVIKVNTRVVCATNKDLPALIREGKFRDDLYYRLAVLDVAIPPLRDRPGDIRVLAEAFASSSAKKFGKEIKEISPRAMDVLASMPFYGNVRELQSVIERLVITADEPVISVRSLDRINLGAFDSAQDPQKHVFETLSIKGTERQLIIDALTECGGGKRDAARLLGIDLSTLYRKIKNYGIAPEEYAV
ncbi:MAG: sigma 54-interacting transcriptional regulator [Clostridia bacterium]|nr:sigma 54-interacting transcriptional regulator [Clostridia bacterium]